MVLRGAACAPISSKPVAANFLFADIHVSQSQEENARSLGALGRARVGLIRIQGCARVPLGGWSLHPMQDRTSICCLGLRRAVTDD